MSTFVIDRQKAAARCMKRVLWLLHWNELQYCYFKYEAGLKYLHGYLKGDTHAISIIERSPVYWGWWKNHWTIREEEYLMEADRLSKITVRMRIQAYKGLHNANMLAAEMNPTSQQLGESYMTMIEMVFAEAKKQEA